MLVFTKCNSSPKWKQYR